MASGLKAVGLPLLCAAALLSPGVAHGLLEARVREAAVGVLLTTAPTVASEARAALIDEATDIWGRAGVRVEWLAAAAARPSGLTMLRVLAVERPSSQTGIDTAVVGELLRVDRSKAIAMLSVPEAERIVARARARTRRVTALTRLHDRSVGIVLGRAAAHEIGHYLLDTSTHVPAGLMRARFDTFEFADPASQAFLLDQQSSAWVQHRVARGLPLGPGAAGDVD
jgi:hypothetical protein